MLVEELLWHRPGGNEENGKAASRTKGFGTTALGSLRQENKIPQETARTVVHPSDAHVMNF